ncbi:hypothetical protein PsYK624_101080 [Phanerochaete sordida]|uniref:Uncharacterized protein n=1 Tax=Phanerochaete sordida TaxID=48140 RepID=A0A9P3LGM3_9APHY|nr:hypothetical protein PsYK624_101080 [Phanerochaete sordida]
MGDIACATASETAGVRYFSIAGYISGLTLSAGRSAGTAKTEPSRKRDRRSSQRGIAPRSRGRPAYHGASIEQSGRSSMRIPCPPQRWSDALCSGALFWIAVYIQRTMERPNQIRSLSPIFTGPILCVFAQLQHPWSTTSVWTSTAETSDVCVVHLELSQFMWIALE